MFIKKFIIKYNPSNGQITYSPESELHKKLLNLDDLFISDFNLLSEPFSFSISLHSIRQLPCGPIGEIITQFIAKDPHVYSFFAFEEECIESEEYQFKKIIFQINPNQLFKNKENLPKILDDFFGAFFLVVQADTESKKQLSELLQSKGYSLNLGELQNQNSDLKTSGGSNLKKNSIFMVNNLIQATDLHIQDLTNWEKPA